MPGRTHGRLSAGEDRFSAVEIVPVGPPITNNHPLITHHFTVRHLPSVIPPILAHPAPLCGQYPSTPFPPVKSDQTPFQTHPHSAPAERSSLLKSLLYKAPFVPAHVAHVGRRKLDSGFGHKLRVIGPVDLACIGPAPNRRPAGMLGRVRTHHFD